MYAATKFGLRGFALALREDLRAARRRRLGRAAGLHRDAGLFADSGATLPRGVGTRSPQDVAAAVVKAITHNRAEVEVAPVGLRVGASFASLAPETAAAVQPPPRFASARVGDRGSAIATSAERARACNR